MQAIKSLFSMLLCALPCTPGSLAQVSQEPPAKKAAAQEVQIIIGQEQVRFTSQKAVQEMQLQVFNQAGEQVYDSGVSYGPTIDWPLQNPDGQPLRSGLYAYTLSVKEQGAEAARVRKGHFIVDRAKDREGADKLWITSQGESGVGTELTVARGENLTIAGASAPEREARAVRPEALEPKRENVQKETIIAANQPGTPNQIPKFISATEFGPSALTEVGGRLGIGIRAPESPLHVHGTHGIITSGPGGAYFFRNRETTTSTDYWAWYASGNIARLWQSGAGDLLTVTPMGVVNYGQLAKLDVATAGAAYIRAADLVFGHPTRRGLPGRAMVDGGAQNGLVINFNGDWTHTTIGSNLVVIGYDFLFGHPSRRGAPGRAFVDGGTDLVVNFNRDWALTRIDSNLLVRGNATVQSLEIKNGADFAEQFDINEALSRGEMEDAKIDPGMVVSIDPASPGKLAISHRAYDLRVAGIISGAGGVKPGMIMGQDGTLASGKHPVALTGRVYVWADASFGAIEPGDLLTTSTTPGHAMKVTDRERAQGAILGKAMTSLKDGKGLVLVLVTLQ